MVIRVDLPNPVPITFNHLVAVERPPVRHALHPRLGPAAGLEILRVWGGDVDIYEVGESPLGRVGIFERLVHDLSLLVSHILEGRLEIFRVSVHPVAIFFFEIGSGGESAVVEGIAGEETKVGEGNHRDVTLAHWGGENDGPLASSKGRR